jgi:alkyldihydroxyacetonephosphate synthase
MDPNQKLRDVIVYNELGGILGYENISNNEVDLAAYSRTRPGWPGTAPDFIAWPESVEQVAEVLRFANTKNIPIIPYCGGEGGAGMTWPLFGGIILDIKRLNKVLEINERNCTVVTQTGIMSQELEWELNAKGLTTAHLPQSQYISGVGGFLAARSTGALSTKYGKFPDMVLGMQVALPNGRIMRTRAVPRMAAGPDLNQLFCGSEGTLGVITEATLVVRPQPEVIRSWAVMMPNLHAGIEAVRKMLRLGLRPCVARLSDEIETDKLWKQERKGAQLILAFDGFAEMVDLELRKALEIVQAEGGEDLGSEVGEAWWTRRYTGVYPNEKPGYFNDRARGLAYGGVIDTAGDFDYLEAIHNKMKESVSRIDGTIFMAHFSHWYPTGGMMYPYIYNRNIPEDPTQIPELFYKLQRAAIQAVLKLGGTINHHHGIGFMLGQYMKGEYGWDGMDVLQSIKSALDPNNIMNPGKLGLEWRES